MIVQDDLMQALRAKRDGYDQELIWHRFLIDAFTGTGGFAGKVKQPAHSYLGWAADVYSNSALQSMLPGSNFNTYLDRYPREDAAKFKRRIDISHYPNYVEAILSTMLSYIGKHQGHREGVPSRLADWFLDVDGAGTSWDTMLNRVVKPRTALLGWMPMLFDAPPLPASEARATLARTDELGIRPRAMPLFPANLLDFELDDDDQFVWAKLRLCYARRADAFSPIARQEVYQLWYPDHLREYAVTTIGNSQPVLDDRGEKPHGFGRVPIAIWRYQPSPEHAVFASGMVDSVSKMARRLFNLLSELDEILRQCTFPMLQVPGSENDDGDRSEVITGAENALSLPHGATHEYKWIVPDGNAAKVYEKRIAGVIREIYRVARDEYDDDKATAESGVARAYKFEKTNRKLCDYAGQLAKAERRCYEIVGPALGVHDLKHVSVTPPDDFHVDDVSADIKNAMDAVELDLPSAAITLIKRRVIEKMLPNLPKNEMDEIHSELDQRTAAI